MIIYSEHITPRLKFIANFLLGELLGIEFSFSQDKEEIINSKLPILNYSANSELKGFHIVPVGLLSESGISPQKIEINTEKNFPVFFKTNGEDLDFDIFSASFYLLSRYEEYLEVSTDKYGRFKAENSLAFHYDFLKLPIVNIWTNHLRILLQNKFPDLHLKDIKSEFQLTIDIDNPWAHLNKSFFRLFAGMLKSFFNGRFWAIQERFRVISGKEKDPYDSFEFINEHHGNDLTCFILVGDKGKYDNKHKITNENWRKRILNLSKQYKIGLHPSFRSNKSLDTLSKENNSLGEIIGKKLGLSRQHYLILRFPETYENLIKIGIKNDFSMGYADYHGFRAGTSSSFNFYNLKKEEETKLRITPFCVMDRTLKDYEKLGTYPAFEVISELIDQIQNHGGIFVSIWHNESFSAKGEWKDWDKLYLDMLKEIKLKFTV